MLPQAVTGGRQPPPLDFGPRQEPHRRISMVDDMKIG